MSHSQDPNRKPEAPAEGSSPDPQGPGSQASPEAGDQGGERGAGQDTGQGARPQGGGSDLDDLMPGLADAVSAEAGTQAEDEKAARIAALEAERDDLKDRLLRSLAETENVRRRADRDRKDAEAYGGTKLARDLLSVHDNLDRAMGLADEAMRASHPGFVEGLELTRRELLNAFAKHRIEKVTPEPGEKFDPNRHQAMFEAPIPGATPGTVIEIIRPGFTIADRLLRPAEVGVAKAVPGTQGAEAGTAAGTGAGTGGDSPSGGQGPGQGG